jgi:hypothetical protein
MNHWPCARHRPGAVKFGIKHLGSPVGLWQRCRRIHVGTKCARYMFFHAFILFCVITMVDNRHMLHTEWYTSRYHIVGDCLFKPGQPGISSYSQGYQVSHIFPSPSRLRSNIGDAAEALCWRSHLRRLCPWSTLGHPPGSMFHGNILEPPSNTEEW